MSDAGGKRKGVRLSDLRAAAAKDADPARVEPRSFLAEDALAKAFVAEVKAKALREQADSATVDMATLISALVKVSEQQAAQLEAMAEEMERSSRAQLRGLRWTIVSAVAAVVAALAAIAVLFL